MWLQVPWWAWVKRFHLPEAEKLNGRAAMVGYLLAGLVDLASGAGLVEQQARGPFVISYLLARLRSSCLDACFMAIAAEASRSDTRAL